MLSRWISLGVWGLVVVLFSNTCLRAQEKQPEVSYAEIVIKGGLAEGAQPPGLFSEISESLDDVIAKFDRVAKDGKISGVILKFGGADLSRSKVSMLRSAIGRVRGAGKKVHAYLTDISNLEYSLAIACDEVCIPESGTVNTLGLRAEVTFYKNAFEMLGIQADAVRVGEFKSAVEAYTRTEMSPEFRMEMEEMLDDLYNQFVTEISQARKLQADQVRDMIDTAPHTAANALERKLIDRVAYPDQMEAAIAGQHSGKTLKVLRNYGKKKVETDLNSLAGMMKFMELVMGAEPPKRKSNNPKLAIITAQGMIVTGKSSVDFLSGEATMGSDTMVKAIREAREDATVKAVVLRINSPGGSALASDLMWRELELLEKPFVVSMGDVAASGGYYIAMGADRIYAEPATITGSIGVFGMKLATGKLMNKVGVTTQVISRGKNSGIFSTTQAFSEGERAAMQKMLDSIYAQFTSKAAQGRKMPVEQLEKLARGRVYTGNAALKIGLVDEIGGIEQAVAHAKKLAGIDPETKLERLDLPKATNPFESLFGGLDANASLSQKTQQVHMVRSVLTEYFPGMSTHFRALGALRVLSAEQAAALAPFDLQIK